MLCRTAAPHAGLQVWKSPGLEKSVAPMELHRTFGQCHSDITTVDWSADSQWLVSAAAAAAAWAQPPWVLGCGCRGGEGSLPALHCGMASVMCRPCGSSR